MSRIFSQIEEIIKKYESKAFFNGKVSEKDIKEAEQILSVRFPDDYRHFIEEYGAGSFGECEIYGILSEKNICRIPNGIWASEYLQRQYHMPAGYIAIAFDGIGGYFCINTNQKGGRGLRPVVLWDMEGKRETENIAEAFDSFFCHF